MTARPDDGDKGSRIFRRSLYAALLSGVAIVIAAVLPIVSHQTPTSETDAVRIVAGTSVTTRQNPPETVQPVPTVSVPAASSSSSEELVPLPEPWAPARGMAMPTDAEWAAPFDALRNQQQQ